MRIYKENKQTIVIIIIIILIFFSVCQYIPFDIYNQHTLIIVSKLRKKGKTQFRMRQVELYGFIKGGNIGDNI